MCRAIFASQLAHTYPPSHHHVVCKVGHVWRNTLSYSKASFQWIFNQRKEMQRKGML
jgi:hypothetical protein